MPNGGKIALEAATNAHNNNTSTEAIPFVQSLLQSKGYIVDIVNGAQISTTAGIGQYSAVLVGDSGFSDNDWNTFGQTLETYVKGGGSVLASGWVPYMLAYPSGTGYTAMNQLMPVGASRAYTGSGTQIIPTATHAITAGVSTWTTSSFSNYGGAVKPGATVVAQDQAGNATAVAWQYGLGNVVHLSANYLVSFAQYGQKPQLDGTNPNALNMFLNSVAWVSGGARAVTATEGTSFTGPVGAFTDPNNNPVSSFTANILWGDGSNSSGTITAGPGTGVYTVSGTNQYLEEGNYNVSVTIQLNGQPFAQITGLAVISDALLFPMPAPFKAVEGTAYNDVVARFTDINPNATAADFKASISWGTDQVTTGTIVANSQGSFDVVGANTYAEQGSFSVQVTISDTGGGGTIVNSMAAVQDAPLQGSAASVTAVEGAAVSGVVATFNDADPAGVVADYAATIQWGDGDTSAGVITKNPQGGFTVNGTKPKAYAENGFDNITVTIIDTDGQTSVVVQSSAAVEEASLAATGGFTVTAVEGIASGNQTVATFTDTGGAEPVANYTAHIDWGNGNSSLGTITLDPNTAVFTVSGDNLYQDEATKVITVTIQHTGIADTAVTSTAKVADAALTPLPTPATATEGALDDFLVVASYTDANPGASAGDTVITIDWGDGQSSAGLVVTNAKGGFDVYGTHKYADEGTYTAKTSINDVGGSTASVNTQVTVAEAGLDATAVAVNAVEAKSTGTVPVATFTDLGGPEAAASYTASIDWGDQTSADAVGTIVANGDGSYTVNGTHAYAEEGGYAVHVTLDHDHGTVAQMNSTATVTDAALQVTALTNTFVDGKASSATVATFVDPGSDGTAKDYAATISWGDGQSSAGMIQSNASGGFDVVGSNTYAADGSFTITVTVTDAGGSEASAHGRGIVPLFDFLTPTPVSASATEGTAFNGALATFTDNAGPDPEGDYTIAINWGDNTSTSGTLQLQGNTFTVNGNHTYVDDGAYTATVTITDKAGATATVKPEVTVAHVVPTLTLSGIDTVNQGATYTLVLQAQEVGTDTITQWNINWDDHSPIQTVTGNPTSVTHVFATPPQSVITATATDEDGTFDAGNHLSVNIVNASTGQHKTVEVPPGETVHVETPVTEKDAPPAVTADLQRSPGATGFATVYVEKKKDIPDGTGNGNTNGGTNGGTGVSPNADRGIKFGTGANSAVFVPVSITDVRVTNADLLDKLTLTFTYSSTIDTDPTVGFLDPATNTWTMIDANTEPPGYFSVDKLKHTVTLLIDMHSNPQITNLKGTVFTISVSAPQNVLVTVNSPLAAASNDISAFGNLTRTSTFVSSTQLTLALSASQATERTAGQTSGTSDTGDGQNDEMSEMRHILGDDDFMRLWLGAGADRKLPVAPRLKPQQQPPQQQPPQQNQGQQQQPKQESSARDALEMFFAQPVQSGAAGIQALDQDATLLESGSLEGLTHKIAVSSVLTADGVSDSSDVNAFSDSRWALAAAMVGLARATRVSEKDKRHRAINGAPRFNIDHL
jgi:hypothetical protein